MAIENKQEQLKMMMGGMMSMKMGMMQQMMMPKMKKMSKKMSKKPKTPKPTGSLRGKTAQWLKNELSLDD